MIALKKSFLPLSAFEHQRDYTVLPVRFTALDSERYVATSLGGEHIVVPRDVLRRFLSHQLDRRDRWFTELESRHLLCDGNFATHAELLAAQYRTRQSLLPELTALHIFVITLRCDSSCQYCQVSRVSADKHAFDMSVETADRAVALMLRSPAKAIKVEFQGGESLLNFPLLRHIVSRTKEQGADRRLEFVVATNLALLTDEMLDYFAEHRVQISTSLDGPKPLHNRNRPRPGADAYERTIAGIERCRSRLGHDSVSALMTCTAESLRYPEEIVDEYVNRGFREVFLRSVSPYGFAAKSADRVGYETDRFIEFFKRGLARILEHNRRGVEIREVYTSILLRRMLTSYPTGYVDLQSPAGLGLSAIVYNYDGDVYASDESRMLAEMGDRSFRLGNVHTDSWERILGASPLLPILSDTMTEGLPGCCDCAFQPYCGSDPIRHHVAQHDIIGHRPTSPFCRKHMGIFRHLITLLEDDREATAIIRLWAQ